MSAGVHSRAAALIAALALFLPAPAAPQRSSGSAGQRATLADVSRSFQELAATAGPAVVQIIATGYALPDGGEGGGLVERRQASGSGVILDPDGFILTNAHVVAGVERVQVLLSEPANAGANRRSIVRPRGRLVDGTVVGIDRETDLAVVSVGEKDLPALELADSEEVRPGQLVLALGSPLGLEGSVTMGIVSAEARQLRPDDRVVYIQTDTPVNPGNSGGPLIDTGGRVVGINTFILSHSGGSEGVGFAVPANIARAVYTQIRKQGHVRRGMIGVNAQTITPELAAGLSLPVGQGVVISDVYPGSPAARSGLRIGDIILSLDGKPMENARQFEVNVYRRVVGELVSLEIRRGTETLTVDVSVIERPDDPDRFAGLVHPDRNLVSRLGILGLDLDPRVLELLPALRGAEGVLVGSSNAGVPPGGRGLASGDVIYAVNGRPIAGLEALRTAVAALPPRSVAVLQVERSGRLMFVTVEVQ